MPSWLRRVVLDALELFGSVEGNLRLGEVRHERLETLLEVGAVAEHVTTEVDEWEKDVAIGFGVLLNGEGAVVGVDGERSALAV